MPRKELGMAGFNSGSGDSMVSTASNHSQHSDKSYDYLSVEEKECLMFLEETIGSLDAEADSGVSTDETDCMEPSKLPGTQPKRDSITRDLENGAPALRHTAEQKSSKSPSAFPSSAPAVVPSSGYYSLPRIVTVANGASDSKVHTVEDPVPVEKSLQEMAKEDRLDQANRRSQMKSLESLLIQPPDPFQDELVSYEWSRSNRSDDKRETTRKTWMSWGQPEKASQDPDTKRGPPTAPKPRKLPPNIILKTSKNSPVALATEPNQKVKAPPPSLASSASDATAEKVNSGHLDPKEREKARREALEKLGLSQDRREPSTHLQPTTHPQQKEVPVPIPAEPQARSGAVERSVPGVRQMTFKSNTLERSGVGLSSYMASAKEQSVKTSSSLGKIFLRSSRPRPVSLGTGKDFAGLKEPGQVEQEKSSKRRSHPLQSFPRPPRSSVSVKISPKGATDENRREALKKLGLLKE
ncbi:Specifically androgen-regulated gene protein [Nestor notabilis]|uniref:Specifically androgen-regulated gene protein n=1 Tax=Nestor notabilis TaxID=176057 RepID=A0A091RS50_NESNO|nr:Specifically androgen-regulated gene protein [Nestor notabilis]